MLLFDPRTITNNEFFQSAIEATNPEKSRNDIQNPLNSNAFKAPAVTIGICLDSYHDDYEISILRGIEKHFFGKNVNVLAFNGGALNAPQYSHTQKNAVYGLLSPTKLDGIILVSSSLASFIDSKTFLRFRNSFAAIPTLSIGMEIPGDSCIKVDNTSGMRDLLKHLIDHHGHKRIAIITGPENNVDSQARLKIYKEILKEKNIKLDPLLIVPGSFFAESGIDAVSILFDQRKVEVDAIVAGNDLMAIQVIEELHRRGIKVPEKIAVTGFDNISEGKEYQNRLTTISQPLFDLGYRAAKKILQTIRDEQKEETITLASKLITRMTCGCTSTVQKTPELIMIPAETATQNALDLLQPIITAAVKAKLDLELSNIVEEKIRIYWAEYLMSALFQDLRDNTSKVFLTALAKTISPSLSEENEAQVCTEILDYIFKIIQTNINDRIIVDNFANILMKARLVLKGILLTRTKYSVLQGKQWDLNFNIALQSLMAFSDIKKFKEAIAKEFPKLGIKSCYINLFEIDDSVTEYALSLVVYENHKIKELPEKDRRFQTKDLFPPGCDPNQNTSFVIMTLHINKNLLGYVVYQPEYRSEQMFEILTVQLSNSVKFLQSQDHALRPKQLQSGDAVESGLKLIKYAKSRLPKESAEWYMTKLKKIMETEKVYTNTELDLPILAQRLGMPRNHLSFVINEVKGKNFYEFINSYRIEEAKRLLEHSAPDSENIIDLALKCGFVSKSTFNKVFKQNTGLTPSEYRKTNTKPSA